MHLRNGELVLKTVKRHKSPFIIKLIAIFIAAAPLYAFLILISKEISEEWLLGIFAVISFFIGIIIALIGFEYLFDKLMITSRRVIWVNWRNPFNREEREAELADIQDIETKEKGLLSKISIFNYGLLEISTAATQGCIAFKDCVDPSDVEHFIFKQIEALEVKHVEKSSDEEWSVN